MVPKKTEISIETHETWVIHRLGQCAEARAESQAWCQICAAAVELLTPDEAAALTGKSLRQIFRQIEQMQLHFLETPTGKILICLPSLLADAKDGKEPATMAAI